MEEQNQTQLIGWEKIKSQYNPQTKITGLRYLEVQKELPLVLTTAREMSKAKAETQEQGELDVDRIIQNKGLLAAQNDEKGKAWFVLISKFFNATLDEIYELEIEYIEEAKAMITRDRPKMLVGFSLHSVEQEKSEAQ